MQQRLMRSDIIHVAAASEARGRVVLAVCDGAPQASAVRAAVLLARVFEARLETLLIECPDVRALTAHGFAREVSFGGRIGALSLLAVAQGQAAETERARKTIDIILRAEGVDTQTATVQSARVEAIVEACRTEGPWNIVCLADPISARDGPALDHLLQLATGATGITVVGPQVRQATGDVIVVVEDIERLVQMVRVAERLCVGNSADAAKPGCVRLLLAPQAATAADDLEGYVRLALPEASQRRGAEVVIDPQRLVHGTAAELAEALRRLDGSFVIARRGGLVAPADGGIDAPLGVLGCPLLLVR